MKMIRWAAAVVLCALCGCGTFGKKVGAEVADRVDLGDGTVLGIVPISLAATAANAVRPGAGDYVNMLEGKLKSQREAKLGPFNGLPYTTTRQVVLKTGAVIPESEIERIVEIMTPTVPGPIIRVIEPANYNTVPATVAPVTNAPPAATPATEEAAATVSNLLEAIGTSGGSGAP